LIGGQVLDLEGEGSDVLLTAAQLRFLHESKTAALLTASIRLGGMTANATPVKLAALTEYGQALGLAFQVIDDILDVTQTSEKLGKSAGKDIAAAKSTYPALFGLEKSRKEAARLTKKAHDALKPFAKKGDRLHEIADYLLDREY
jgi:geranylgeranyl diphosphate synthase type II